ncbi:MAG: hypothetical protein VX733_11750 [Candidatus Latescibacterota bacterium]|nr:hypothetical protein [Candidatus Latescibacterota bacterium]
MSEGSPVGLVRGLMLVAYDRLGSLVLLNLVWDLAVFPWALLSWLLLTTGISFGETFGGQVISIVLVPSSILVLLSPPSLFLAIATQSWMRREPQDLRSCLRKTLSRLWKAQAVAVAVAVAAGVLVANAVLYQTRVADSDGPVFWLGLSMCGLMLWLLVGVLMLALYLFPALTEKESDSLGMLLKRSLFLVFDNGLFSFGLLTTVGLLLILAVLSGVGPFLGALPLIALILNGAYLHLMRRYRDDPAPDDPRTYRDLLRPWD